MKAIGTVFTEHHNWWKTCCCSWNRYTQIESLAQMAGEQVHYGHLYQIARGFKSCKNYSWSPPHRWSSISLGVKRIGEKKKNIDIYITCSSPQMSTKHTREERRGRGRGNPLQPQNNCKVLITPIFAWVPEWIGTKKKSCGIKVFDLLFLVGI